MSFAGWGSGGPVPTNSLPLGAPVGFGGGGWAAGFTGVSNSGNSLQLQDEAKFNSLFPVAGFVTGEQVKPIFEASGLMAAQLAQIWASVDKDHDGRINKAEFCTAMAMIRQQQSTGLNSSLPASSLTPGFGTGLPQNPSKSWSTAGFGVGVTPPSPSSSSPGVGISRNWAIKPQDMRKYMLEFNNLDVSKTGFLSGPVARTILTKSGLDKMTLVKLWELSDIDRDGRLSDDEYAIAMHLVAKVKGGALLPSNLPAELYPGPTKYHTVDRAVAKAGKPPLEKKNSIPDKMGPSHSPGMGGHARNLSGGGHARNSSGGAEAITFEDRRKENFEAGRMELERRRRAIKEQQERETAEKERRKREEEERRKQQEHEAELARQAELERQHRKAVEIEQERVRQMQRLALRREEEQRELERKRKAEWTRKKCVELEGQRDWEKKSLYSLRVQHSHLEDQLRQLDQKQLSIQASTQRQKTMFSKIIVDLKTMRLSHEVRRAEITKLQSALNGYHSQLGSLQRQRRELRETLQGQSPEMSLYQEQRQQLKDKIIGLAASLAGLRSNISYNTKSVQELTETFKSNSQLLADLKKTLQADDSAVSELREKALAEQAAYEEAQRVRRAEEARREEEERKEREERERVRREVEERAMKEARLERIKKEQAMALNKAKVEKVMTTTAITKPLSAGPPSPTGPPVPSKLTPKLEATHKPQIPTKPTNLVKKKPSPEPPSSGGWTMEDELVKKKVLELQKRKAKLQQERENQKAKVAPASPSKKELSKQASVEKETKSKGKLFKQESEPKAKAKGKKGKAQPSQTEQQLLDLNSSWDSTAQISPGISSFAKDTSQILLPLKPLQEEEGEEEGGVQRPIPKPRSMSVSPEPEDTSDASVRRFSVARLSELFDKGKSPVQGWSSDIQPRSKSIPNEDSDYTNLDSVTTGRRSLPSPVPIGTSPLAKSPAPPTASPAPSPAPQPASPTTRPISYKVLYAYQAADESEVTLVQGDTVTFVPRGDTSPGWLMVRVADGAEGWAPESYLEAVAEVTSDGGVSRATGQVMSQDSMEPKSPTLSPASVQAKVLFSWKGSKDNHLSLVRGEVVQVLQQSDKWWSGELQGKVGWFPKTFVKILEPDTSQPEATPTPQAPPTPQAAPTAEDNVANVQYEAIYDYEGAEGDLAFQAGDIIEVTSSDGEWWTGVLNGVTGTFPSNYVQLKQEAPASVSSTPLSSLASSVTSLSSLTTPSQAKPNIARVLVAYQTSKPGQLNLTPGQLIKILKQPDSGWWEGEVQSRGKKRELGWFPANRVQLLPPRQPNKSSSSSVLSSPSRSVSEGSEARAKSPLLEALEEPKSNPVNLVLALYTYSAQSADELSFHKGSVVTVLEKEGEWWKGEVNDKCGLFPSNYVQPLTEQQPPATEPTRWADSVSPEVLGSVSDTERKRQEAIFELLTSERHYVDSLKLVKEVFFDPLAQDQVLTEEEMAKVMVNWDELIRCSSDLLSSFLVRLRTSGEVVRSIGDVLTSQIPNLTPHIRWCGCQLNACLLLQQKSSDPKFKEFELKCSTDPRTGGLPLSSFLLKPMQRVTKYPLLVKRIMDYTNSTDNDYTDLKAALTEAETLCYHVNEGVKQKENTEQLEWLQAHVSFNILEEFLVFNSQTNFMGPRKLLHWGKFFKIRGSKDLVGFLFNDFLLLVRPKLFFPKAATPADLEPWGKNEFQMYRKPYLLDSLRAKKAGSDANGAMLSLLQTSSEEKDILLRVDGEQARDQWVKKLTKAYIDFITVKKKMEREKREQYMRTLRDSVGTLEVTVIKGADLLAKDPNGKSDPFCVIRLGEQQEQTTPVIQNSLNPKWNCMMKFAVHDINKDTLDLTVFDKDLFSPNDFLGSGRISLKDLLGVKDSPWEKTVLLEGVASGEVTLKIALTLNESDLLL